MYQDGARLSGKLVTRRPDNRPVKRPPGKPTPCDICPKGNPVDGERIDRNLPKAMAVYSIYNRVQATAGRCLDEADMQSEIVSSVLGIAAPIVRAAESRKAVEPLQEAIDRLAPR